MGYTQKELGDSLNVSRVTVNNSLQRGEENRAMSQEIWDKMSPITFLSVYVSVRLWLIQKPDFMC